MPFLNRSVRDYLDRQNYPKFQETLGDLEATLGVPIRALHLGQEARDRAGHTTWRGAARELQHYAEGTTEEDFHEKGITIFLSSWNDNNDDRPGGVAPGWQYGQFNIDDMVTAGRGRYETGGDPLPHDQQLEYYGYTTEQIAQMDCIGVEENGVHVVDLWDQGRCVYVSPALFVAANYGYIDWFKYITEPIQQATDPEALARAREAMAERARIAFTAMMEDRGDAAIEEARQKAAQYAIEAAELQEKLVNAHGNREQYARQLMFLLEQEGDLTEEMVTKEWEGITRNVNVERFTAGQNRAEDAFVQRENPWLKVFTKDLFLTNPNTGRKLALGKYEVTMNFGSNTLRIRNLTMPQHGGTGFDAARAREGVGQWDHPHVLNGKLCTAEFATAITQLLRDRKLAQMTNMMFSILGTVTLDDNWGQHNIRLWEEADTNLRAEKGWPAWTADETEHPMEAALREENNDG